MQKIFYSKKKPLLDSPPFPVDYSNASLENLPEYLKIFADGDRFVLFNELVNGKQIMMFGSKSGLQMLEHAMSWSCDGTFPVG